MPSPSAQNRTVDLLAQAGLFGVALWLYWRTLAPGLTWRNNGADGGDLIAAAASFGIPHPSGYPAYMLLARAFLLLPTGSEAYRLNLLSAVCAAAAVAVFYGLLLQRQAVRWWGGRLAAANSALFLAITPEVWSQATITEVYSLHLLFVMLVLVALGRWRRSLRLRDAVVAGAILGLGLGNHLTLILTAPVAVIYLIATADHSKGSLIRQLASWSAGIGLGLSVYLYLPMASWLGSNFHWGRVDSPAAFLLHVGGSLYRGYVFALPPSELPGRLVALVLIVVSSLQAWGIVLAIVGVVIQWRHDRIDTLALSLPAAASAVFALSYFTSDSLHYLAPVVVVIFTWLGLGIERLLALLVRARDMCWATLLAALALIAVTGVTGLSRFAALDLSADRAAELFALQALNPLPARSILISATDRQTFALWYFTEVRQLRPDVVVVDRDLLAYAPYRRFLSERWPTLQLGAVENSASVTASDGMQYKVVQLPE